MCAPFRSHGYFIQNVEHSTCCQSEPDGTNIIRFLLAKGADIGARTRWGDTAAHYAALKGTKEVLDLVCAEGASIVKDKDNAAYREV